MSDQWIRKASLIVADGEEGLDLSELHFKFKVDQSDLETPNNCIIRVYNLSDKTAQAVEKEYTRVVLQAGYQNGAFGIIFDGTIKQVRRGRENATDKYLDILAADGDIASNFGVVSSTLSAGATPEDQTRVLADAMGVDQGYVSYGIGATLPRGKVLYGMARDHLRRLSQTAGSTWSIQNGKIQVVPLSSYLPSEAVVLTSRTGLIGLPEQTEDGIKCKCLLNPKIRIGSQVQIDNASIQRQQISFEYTAFNIFPTIADDGFYKVLVAEFEGDTRGNPWYTNIVGLVIDKTSPPQNSVKPYG